MVVACLAAMTGWIVGTCDVAKMPGYRVEAPIADAHENDSNPCPLKLVTPPKPFQRPTGTSASNSISSPMRASASVSGQVASSTPSMLEMAQPPLRLEQKVPSLSLRVLNSGLVASRNWSGRALASIAAPQPGFPLASE